MTILLLRELIISILAYIPFDFELAAIIVFIALRSRLELNELYIGFVLLIACLLDIGSSTINGDNQWFFNYSMIVIITVNIVFYFRIFKSATIQKLIIFGYIIFLLAHVTNMFLWQGTGRINTFTILPAQAAIGYLSFLYMRQKVESSDQNPFEDFIFWFSVANMVSFIGTIPVLATLDWFSYEHNEIAGLLYNINSVIAYYINFSIIIFGLLWTRKYQV